MSDVPTIVSDAIEAHTNEVAALSGAVAYLAAMEHAGTAGEQRQLAACIYHTSKMRFGGVKYDGQLIENMTIEELDRMWLKMTGKRLRK